MSSDAQRAANRANSQLSTGPQTQAGVAAIAHNNFRHGLASDFVVLPTEDHLAFEDLLLSLNLEFSPSTETEEALVTAMAQHHWLTQRALRLQQPLFETAVQTGAAPDAKQLGLYLRYQSTNDRAYHKALSQLLRLRSDRRRSQIGFESQKARNDVQEIKLVAFAEAQQAKQTPSGSQRQLCRTRRSRKTDHGSADARRRPCRYRTGSRGRGERHSHRQRPRARQEAARSRVTKHRIRTWLFA
jgi:hypothetical protein